VLQKPSSDDTYINFKKANGTNIAGLRCESVNDRFMMKFNKYGDGQIGIQGNAIDKMQPYMMSTQGFYIGAGNSYVVDSETNNKLLIDTQIKTTFTSALSNGFSNWTSYSDSRLKKNIIDINLQMAYNNFKTLQFKRYSFIHINKHDAHETGLIAQDVLLTPFSKSVESEKYYEDIIKTRTIKKIIQEEKDGEKCLENGKVEKIKYMIDKEIEVEEEYKEHVLVGDRYTLNYDEINRTSLCVIQKLQLKVDDLECDNVIQRNKINNLENTIIGMESIINRMRLLLKI
jgi:hypothetical protein